MATVPVFQSPFITIGMWNPETQRHEPKTILAGQEQDPIKRYANASAAKGNKTVWDEASKTYKQAPVLSKSEFDKTDAMNQWMQIRQAMSGGAGNVYGPGSEGTIANQLQASYGTLRNQMVGAGEGMPQESNRGTLDPLYDSKYQFWNKGIPSKYYDPPDPNFDPSKPSPGGGFIEQQQRERKARERWIKDMTPEQYALYRRSLNQGPGSAGEEADRMRNPAPAEEEKYGDPYQGRQNPGLGFNDIMPMSAGMPAPTQDKSTPVSTKTQIAPVAAPVTAPVAAPVTTKPEARTGNLNLNLMGWPDSKGMPTKELTPVPSQPKTGLGRTTAVKKLPVRARRYSKFAV